MVNVCADISEPETVTRELKGLLEAFYHFKPFLNATENGTTPDEVEPYEPTFSRIKLLLLTMDEQKTIPHDEGTIEMIESWRWILQEEKQH